MEWKQKEIHGSETPDGDIGQVPFPLIPTKEKQHLSTHIQSSKKPKWKPT